MIYFDATVGGVEGGRGDGGEKRKITIPIYNFTVKISF